MARSQHPAEANAAPFPAAVSQKADQPAGNLPAANNSSQTNVTVNGQTVPVPANGSVHKTIVGDSSNTDVTVNNSQTSNGGSNSSSVNIQVHSP